MTPFLAYAEGPDASDTNLVVFVIALGIIVAVCILAVIPVAAARRRRLGKGEGLAALMVVWALVTAGDAIYQANAQMTWSKEYTLRVQSGYYNPRDQSDRPKTPWLLWGILATVYVGTVVWCSTAPPYTPPPPPAGFEVIKPKGHEKMEN